jgi:hypothetical protein
MRSGHYSFLGRQISDECSQPGNARAEVLPIISLSDKHLSQSDIRSAFSKGSLTAQHFRGFGHIAARRREIFFHNPQAPIFPA